MKLLSGLFLVSCVLLMFGCKKYIKPEYPYENGCERFAGVYEMYDPINDEHYTMIIDCTTSSDPNVLNTMVFTNYANQFNFRRSKKNTPYSNHIELDIVKPIIDQNGYRWIFTNGGGGYISSSHRNNVLVGDSLYIMFSMNNALYYVEDDIPYYDCDDCRHYGVKIH